MSTIRILKEAKPATVLIVTAYTATVEVPNVIIPPDRQQVLNQVMVQKVQNGEVASDQASVIKATVMELLDHWQQYLAPAGTTRTVDASVEAVGSGFFITPDGYLVTNAHVVADEGEELKVGLANNALTQLIDQDVQEFVQILGGSVDDEMLKKLRQTCVDFYLANMQLSNIERTVDVELGVGVPGIATTQKAVRAEVVQMGTPIPGKDVAILKIQGDNLPTLELGDDKALQDGERIYPLGFPADATFYKEFDVSSAGIPSVTQGLVSAHKPMREGWTVIQTDAAIRGGNSGGPVLDSRGKVIGLSTFSLIDRETGNAAVGANFVVPMTVVQEFLTRANVKPAASQVTKLHQEALDLMEVHYYALAKEKLNQIETLKPGQPWVQERKMEVEKAISEGKDESPKFPIVPAVIGGVVVLLVIVGLAFVLGRKGGGPRQPQYPQEPPQQIPPPGPPPQLG